MNEKRIEIDSISTRYFEGGSGETTVVLVHGGLFSNNGLCMNAVFWDMTLASLAADFRVLAPDSLGQGRTGQPRDNSGYSVRGMIEHLRAFLGCCVKGPAHLVGHDEGALLAVRLAFEVPELVASCTIVNSAAVAPVGDGIGNLTLASPLQPAYGAAAQRWVVDQCSYTPHHINEALIQECVEIAGTQTFQAVRTRMEDMGLYATQVLPDLAALRANNFARWRDGDLGIPVQLIWGAQDPISPSHYARTLHGIIAMRTDVAQLHLISRAGYMPFRERPQVFNEIVRGFVRAVSS